jgi:predicted GNAT family acetyltransferase
MHPPYVEHAMNTFPPIFDDPGRRREAPASRVARPARPDAGAPGAETAIPADLGALPTRQLRRLCDRTYQLLDTTGPSLETREQYDALVEELERRERRAAALPAAEDAAGTFRDNALFSRFELYRDGVMAGYLQYEMRGGQIRLLHVVVDPRFRRLGLETVLLRSVLLEAHRRRLAVIPCCPEAREFLADHPRFLPLIPAGRRRRFRLLMGSRAGATGQDPR